MKGHPRLHALALALFGLGCGTAHAAGFQLMEQSASGLGNAYAGSAAVAEDASTIFFNPAGMTRLAPREVSVGVNAIRPTFKFHDRNSSVGALQGTYDGSDAGSWAALPNAYLSWQLTPEIYAGLGLNSPFGLMTEYRHPWKGGAHSQKFDIKTYNINPSIAWKVNDRLSLGAGLDWQRITAQYNRLAAVVNPALAGTQVHLDISDDTWGWNVGAIYQATPQTRFGLSYRAAIKHELEGNLKFRGPAAGANAALANGSASTDVELPATAILSAVHEFDPRLTLLADLSWTGWSSIDKFDIQRTSGVLDGQTVQVLDTAFRDTWRAALGATYAWRDDLKLKFGVAWDQTPVRDPEHRLTSLPDNNRTWFTVGTQWTVAPGQRIDLAGAYLWVPQSRIHNDQSAEGRGLVDGVYDARVWIFGAQYSVAF